MNFLRPVVVVVVAASLPFFAACGARVAGEPENEQSQEGAAAALTDTGPPTNDAGASTDKCAPTTEFGKLLPGSGCFPCTTNTTAYYSDPGPPPATGGCRDLYTPTTRHSTGSVISIVAPAGGGSCLTQACYCGESGRWEPSSSPGCSF